MTPASDSVRANPGSPPVVDAHVHLFQTPEQSRVLREEDVVVWEYGPDSLVELYQGVGDIDDALSAMDRWGVDYAVVVNLYATTVRDGVLIEELPRTFEGRREALEATALSERLIAYNEWLCAVAASRTRIIPVIAVDPWVIGGDDAAAHVKHMTGERGARGVKLHPHYGRFDVLDVRLGPVFEVCTTLGVPVVMHCGRNEDGELEPTRMRSLLQDFPDLRLVLAHSGGPAWQQVVPLAHDFPSLRFDISEFITRAGTDWPGSPSDLQLTQFLREIGSERVMFGSDFPFYDAGEGIRRVRSLPLAPHERDNILGLSALEVFGIDTAACATDP